MDPENADEQPFLSEPVFQWSTQHGLLVPVPSDDATGPLWVCVPGEPLIQGPLALLLWLVGAVTASATASGAAWSVLVDIDRALEHVPSEHRAALHRSFQATGIAAGSQIELEVRMDGESVATVDAEVPAVEGVCSRALLHVSIDAGQPPEVPKPPAAGTVVDADQYVRAKAVDWPDDMPVRQLRPRT